MTLYFNTLLKMMDALDEFFYNHKSSTPEDLVKHKFASNVDAATRVLNIYQDDPDHALISIVCDHFNPDKFATSKIISWLLPSDIIEKEMNILNYLIRHKEVVRKRLSKKRHFKRPATAVAN